MSTLTRDVQYVLRNYVAGLTEAQATDLARMVLRGISERLATNPGELSGILPPQQIDRMNYEIGYRDGESNHHADWAIAFDDLEEDEWPDDVEPWPSNVVPHIHQQHALIAELLDAGSALRFEFVRDGKATSPQGQRWLDLEHRIREMRKPHPIVEGEPQEGIQPHGD